MNIIDRVVAWILLILAICCFLFLVMILASHHASAGIIRANNVIEFQPGKRSIVVPTDLHEQGGPITPSHWFGSDCCSGIDCRVYTADQVEETPEGWKVEGRDKIIPYTSHGIRNSPPEAGGDYGLCTDTKQDDEYVWIWDANHELICFYVPPRGF